MPFTAATIARVLAVPQANVEASWPWVLSALSHEGILCRPVEIAAAATIGTEVPAFLPIHEMGGAGYFIRMYWDRPNVRHALGNESPDDAVKFHGRGFIQLTGRDNYELYGGLIGQDLVRFPDKALEPEHAAAILASYFRRSRVSEAAINGDWRRVRMRVNGGMNGWDRFWSLVQALTKETAA